MSRMVPLSLLKTRVRQRTDVEAATRRIGDAEVVDDINEGIAEVWQLLVKNQSHRFSQATTSATCTAAVETLMGLPTPVLQVVNLESRIDGVTTRILPYEETERPDLLLSRGRPLYFRVVGNNIVVLPIPDAAYTFTLTYVPTATKLVDDDDTFDGIVGFEELVVLQAAKRVAFKQGAFNLVNLLRADIAQEEQKIISLAPKRQVVGPAMIHVDENSYPGNNWSNRWRYRYGWRR